MSLELDFYEMFCPKRVPQTKKYLEEDIYYTNFKKSVFFSHFAIPEIVIHFAVDDCINTQRKSSSLSYMYCV